jgi:hypothetical protein
LTIFGRKASSAAQKPVKTGVRRPVCFNFIKSAGYLLDGFAVFGCLAVILSKNFTLLANAK